MIGRDVLLVTLTNKFTWRERFKILFGFSVVNQAQVEVTAKGNIRLKEIKITHEMKGAQTFLGLPQIQNRIQGEGPSS